MHKNFSEAMIAGIDNGMQSQYPRSLTSRERAWIDWILPADRPGYNTLREQINSLVVVGQGRRGAGEIILGKQEAPIDLESPLPPVFAYGAIETNFGTMSITVREVQDDQLSVEIVSHRGEIVQEEFEEFRRWTYSTWNPDDACPQCENRVREVSMHTQEGKRFVLAICPHDKRLWVHDATSRVSRLIPVTNYYNELMLHKNIRDPKIALDSKNLFSGLEKFSDEDLTYAFFTYNKIREKVSIGGTVEADARAKPPLLKRLAQLFGKDTPTQSDR